MRRLEDMVSSSDLEDEVVSKDKLSTILVIAEKKLGEYYDRTSDAYYAATLLNPALKMEYYKMGSGAGHVTTDHVYSAMVGVMRKFQSTHPSLCIATSAQTPAMQRKKKKGGMADVLRQIMPRVPTTIEYELNAYLAAPLVTSAEDECDILQWWSENERAYPLLAAMARCFLAVPATSAPSECAFSQARHLVTDERHSLGTETIRECMCLKY